MEANEGHQLVIIALDEKGNWVVDEDSAHILDGASDACSAVTLSVSGIEPLPIKQTGITTLAIQWRGAKVLPEFEDALGALLAEYGLKRWASGFDFASEERDLAFEAVKGG